MCAAASMAPVIFVVANPSLQPRKIKQCSLEIFENCRLGKHTGSIMRGEVAIEAEGLLMKMQEASAFGFVEQGGHVHSRVPAAREMDCKTRT